MEPCFPPSVGLFFAVGDLSDAVASIVIRILLGVAIFGNAVNLLIFTAGRITARGAADHSGRARHAGGAGRQSAAAGADPDGDRHLASRSSPFCWCWPIAPTRSSGRTTPTACASPNRRASRRRWDTDDGDQADQPASFRRTATIILPVALGLLGGARAADAARRATSCRWLLALLVRRRSATVRPAAGLARAGAGPVS